jgi:biofilm PGA synthesis lipoprotein PgaB
MLFAPGWGKLVQRLGLQLLALLLGLILWGPHEASAQVARAGNRTPLPAVVWPDNSFVVICYHDIQDDLLARPDNYTTETRELALQFEWLRSNGYHVVSLDDVIASRRDHKQLPARAVLLSFDDGLESVYTRAFPLLEAFHYPAIVGLVGTWRDDEKDLGPKILYGGAELASTGFLSKAQIQVMQRSGLIEFGSHTFDLHHGILANPQGNLEPAVVARRFSASKGYESETAYLERVRTDLAKNSRLIQSLTGKSPRVVVWPYGAYNQASSQIAAQLGMPYALTLDEGVNTPDVPLDRMRRVLITHDVTTRDLAWTLEKAVRPEPMRVMHVDLDYVYDADAAQQESNLSALLDRVKAMGVNTVFLQAYADPDGKGSASALYFPNRHLPMRADLFNRVAWQLRTRCGVAVYAWLPVLAFTVSPNEAAGLVTADPPDKGGDVHRLSPFDARSRQIILDVYQDLSTYGEFQGLLFSDDATLNDFEDASPAALAEYRKWGLPADVVAIRNDPALLATWTQHKTRFLTDFTLQLAAEVRRSHSDLHTARNIFASVVLDAASEAWFAQSYSNQLRAYDYVAIMAMPLMEGHARDANEWLSQLVVRAMQAPGASAKTVFELQSVDWTHQGKPVPSEVLARQMQLVRTNGGDSFGYYPDDFPAREPRLDVVRPEISLKSFPAND